MVREFCFIRQICSWSWSPWKHDNRFFGLPDLDFYPAVFANVANVSTSSWVWRLHWEDNRAEQLFIKCKLCSTPHSYSKEPGWKTKEWQVLLLIHSVQIGTSLRAACQRVESRVPNCNLQKIPNMQPKIQKKNKHGPKPVITVLETVHPSATNLGACTFLSMLLADKNATALGNRGQVPEPSADKTDEEALSLHSLSSALHSAPAFASSRLHAAEACWQTVKVARLEKFLAFERFANNADLRAGWWPLRLCKQPKHRCLWWAHVPMKCWKKDWIRVSYININCPRDSELNALPARLINYTSARDVQFQSVLWLLNSFRWWDSVAGCPLQKKINQ